MNCQPRNRCGFEKIEMLPWKIKFSNPTNSTNQPELDSNQQPKKIIMSFTGVKTAAPTGGSRYAATNYILRVEKKACKEGTEPHQTEAIFIKKGLVTDITDKIEIHTRCGEVFTSIDSYLKVNADFPRLGFVLPCMLEVLVVTSEHGSGWINWSRFEDESQPSTSEEMMHVPPPYVLPQGGAAYGAATYEIRHYTLTEPAQPSTKRRATLTIRDINDHFIKDKLGQHYFSLPMWNLNNPFATDDDIAKDNETNGSPWSRIDILVGEEWVPGTVFLSRRNPTQPGFDGPVPRSNAETIYDFHEIDFDAEAFEEAYLDREALNLSITEVMEKFGPGIPEGYIFDPEEFEREFEACYLNPQNYWDDMSFGEVMFNYGPRPPLNF